MTDWYSLYRTRPARRTFQAWDRGFSYAVQDPVFNFNLGSLPSGRDITQAFPRQGTTDTNQPVWGWFSGGGWAFGRVENSTHRLTTETYVRYRNAGSGQRIPLTWAESDATGARIVRTEFVTVGVDIPAVSSLRTIDQYTLQHDEALANARRERADALALASTADLKRGYTLYPYRDENSVCPQLKQEAD
jgi:hypothetical protein